VLAILIVWTLVTLALVVLHDKIPHDCEIHEL